MIELTEQQRLDVGDGAQPVLVIDPITKREFFLVPAEAFLRLRSSLEDIDPRDTYPAVDRVFAPDWEDPKMADYDDYEKNRR